MSRFFNLFAVVCVALLGVTLVSGYGILPISPETHLLLGVASCLLTVSLHCLIFAIFTGSGKDTRELVQELHLETGYIARTKIFKRTVFPPALYAIFWLLATAVAGGALGSGTGGVVGRWAHQLLALFTVYYNIKTILKESSAVRENATILSEVNATASAKLGSEEMDREHENTQVPLLDSVLEPVAWGTHVFALGKFLTFLGYNTWLPYFYFRYVMGLLTTPLPPFIAASALFFAGGYYLRWRYRTFRPPARST